MRDDLVRELDRWAAGDPRVVMVTGDLGFGVLDRFWTSTDRLINAGVAEQNMMAVCAGLATAGHLPIAYSIGVFPTLRCLEQLRNDVCYHGLPVTIVSVGGGFGYGALGPSHHCTEDLGALRSLPNLDVYHPADPEDIAWCVAEVRAAGRPAVIRVDRSATIAAPVNADGPLVCRGGSGPIAVLALGSIADVALEPNGLPHPFYTLYTVRRFAARDTACVANALRGFRALITIEEHQRIGGLGSYVAELTSECGPVPVRRLGLADTFSSEVGDQLHLRLTYGLTGDSLKRTAASLLDSL